MMNNDTVLNHDDLQQNRRWVWIFWLAILVFAGVVAETWASEDNVPPAWAFPVDPPGLTGPRDDGTMRHVPGSALGYTLSQVQDSFLAPDWHPQDHLPMP